MGKLLIADRSVRSYSRKMNTISLFIADKNKAILAALSEYLDLFSWLNVVGTASVGEDVLEAVKSLQPDAVLLDINLGSGIVLEQVQAMRNQFPDLYIVVCSLNDDPVYARAMLTEGADVYTPKMNLVASLPGILQALMASNTTSPSATRPTDLPSQSVIFNPKRHKLFASGRGANA